MLQLLIKNNETVINIVPQLGTQIWKRLKRRFGQNDHGDALVISRQDHKVSRKFISDNALKVLYRLNQAGFSAYLVGGSVRDLLLNRKPKDFDVATSAHPEQVRKIFRNSRIIGRRFRLVHVYFQDEIIEVSTFRANSEELIPDESGDLPVMVSSDNTYGTIEEDAWRRDFTVNALYYNIENFSVIDYAGGMLDLRKKLIRMIGDPTQRFHEDPVRLLRAIRLSAKLGFHVEAHTEAPIFKLTNLLWHVPPARLFDEILKLFFEGNAVVTYQALLHYGYMRILFPITYNAIKQRHVKADVELIRLAMEATDARFAAEKSLNPGFLMAVLLWPAVLQGVDDKKTHKKKAYQALLLTVDDVLTEQLKTVSIPKRLTAMMRSVWLLQTHLLSRRGRRIYKTLSHRYFRAAFDFLELRVKTGEPYQEIYEWWKAFQDANNDERAHMVSMVDADKNKGKNRHAN